jgi:SNF2 family DNA or RNA helicase
LKYGRQLAFWGGRQLAFWVAVFSGIYTKLDSAVNASEEFVLWDDSTNKLRRVPITKDLISSLNALHDQFRTSKSEKGEKREAQYVLIYENDENIDYSEHIDKETNSKLTFTAPRSLIQNLSGEAFELKDYQKKGVAWLQSAMRRCLNDRNKGRQGVLLADDMGLGKTLQVLTFLSWCIEDSLYDVVGRESGPYKPCLIIAPVILLENWKREVEKFFVEQGQIFLPYEVLYGDSLKAYKTSPVKGKEFEIGQSILNLEKIKGNRLVITNYDTIKNYQHSFAQVEWSVIVIDEAQEIKEVKTAVSMATKSLNATFKIAMTGTPVENRLLDLWNLTDFFRPGLLGSAKEFSETFERDVQNLSEGERLEKAALLRSKLRYDAPNAYLLRRTKADELDGLPPKREFIRYTELSDEQVMLHKEILGALKNSMTKAKGQHLTAIQRLSKIYQHPALELRTGSNCTPKQYREQSPKMEDVVRLLHEIKSRREKVLVFALFTKMQMILKEVFDDEFGLNSRIINGNISGTKSASGGGLRQRIIDDFQNKNGFDLLILSPDVAGVGLNITAANNVIHYGRWWNPAKEAQATDRVYRLGQTLPVNVYYPISKGRNFPTFDDRLHELLEKKKQLSADFLMPSANLELSETEIVESLVSASDSSSISSNNKEKRALDVNQLDTEKFIGLCGAIYSADGFLAKLAPVTQHQGIHVIAVKGRKMILIRCAVESASAREIDQLSQCRPHLQKLLPGFEIGLAFFSKEALSKEIITTCKSNGVEAFDVKKITTLAVKSGIGLEHIYSALDNRISRLEDLQGTFQPAIVSV